ncbi:MAG: TlyA family RNA methyltransferase [bacterium]|nr:TlyA family RNA methyltransferase [bacterium]
MKERIDKILVDRGYAENKSKAQGLILAGHVKVNGEKITKAAQGFDSQKDMLIEVITLPFVSRGGLKLDKAVKAFSINLKNKICLDAGASTGGFTDCMLQNDAKKVYAVDVGYGQIAWKIRQDARVKTIERTNIKNCGFLDIFDSEDDEKCDFCAMDLSFISVTKVLENIKNFLKPNFEVVTLIKPQFEAGREYIEKKGVVKDKKVHEAVIKNLIDFASGIGMNAQKLTFSPITGPAGNIEYLLYLTPAPLAINEEKILEVVASVDL